MRAHELLFPASSPSDNPTTRSPHSAFKSGNIKQAYKAYRDILEHGCEDPSLLCNLSFAAYKLKQYDEAEQVAQRAIDILRAAPGSSNELSARSFHRKAQAQAAAQAVLPALRTYKQSVLECKSHATGLAAAARLLLDRVPASWLSRYWTDRVGAAESKHPLSARDGLLLKQVPLQRRLESSRLQSCLCAAFQKLRWQEASRDLIMESWARSQVAGRQETAFFRALAYLEADDAEQAVKDVAIALAYGPRRQDRPNLSAWPDALALQSAALEALGQNVPAVVAVSRALELSPSDEDAVAAQERLLRRVPEQYAIAVQSRGADGLEALLDEEKERAQPEFLKPRPKYYYYYQWMRRRIEERHPNLPECIMDKMLTLDATELDLLMRYPAAVDGTIASLQLVLDERGEDELASTPVPLLSYDQVKELETGDAITLPALEDAGGMALQNGEKQQSEDEDAASSTDDEHSVDSSEDTTCLMALEDSIFEVE
jgi:tetratricopeptide (TPR) repeat protein